MDIWNLWAIDGKLYCLDKFILDTINPHPGGKYVLLAMMNKDCTDIVQSVHKRSIYYKIEKYRVTVKEVVESGRPIDQNILTMINNNTIYDPVCCSIL